MGYCFMSIEKVKTAAQLAGKWKHNYRQAKILNVDESKSHLNEELLERDTSKTYNEEFWSRIQDSYYYKKHKVRRDNVLALEVVTTFSREDFDKIDVEQWKKDNVKWLQNTFNTPTNPDNVVSVMYHADETGNVHCHAMVIPIDEEGKLNAKLWTGGPSKMRKLQNSYYKEVGFRHRLKRGLENSKATHQDIKKFYAELNHTVSKKLPEPTKDETTKEYYERANQTYQDMAMLMLQERKKHERKLAEAKTKTFNEAAEYIKLKRENEQLRGNLDFIINSGKKKIYQKAFLADKLEYGLKNYPNREYAKEAEEKVNQLCRYSDEERNLINKEIDYEEIEDILNIE